MIGFILVSVSTAGLGLISNIKSPKSFKYAAIVLRFFQGQGDVLLQITCYSVVTSTFSNDIVRYIGYIEIAAGIGLGLGPSIGSIVFGLTDFQWTMYFFAGLNVFALIICYLFIPNELN